MAEVLDAKAAEAEAIKCRKWIEKRKWISTEAEVLEAEAAEAEAIKYRKWIEQRKWISTDINSEVMQARISHFGIGPDAFADGTSQGC